MQLGIPDEEFIRGNVPMTKQEIRILSVAKLQVQSDSVVYDIGAGTGSVSVELAAICSRGTVYAVEENPEAQALLQENVDKFARSNIQLIKGSAPECIGQLPAPTHVFIGGSKGKLLDIIESVRGKNPAARFVVTAITLETIAQLGELSRQYSDYADMELVQVGIARGTLLGTHHLMKAENPVYIASFGGDRKE